MEKYLFEEQNVLKIQPFLSKNDLCSNTTKK